jgi:hypothetical protein
VVLFSVRAVKQLACVSAVGLVAGLVAAPSAFAAGHGTPVPLTAKPSVHLSRLAVVGVSDGYGVIYNSVESNTIYRAMPNGSGLHRVASGSAVAVARGEILYDRSVGSTSVRRYLDLSNGHTGVVPTGAAHSWAAPAPHGGLHVGKQADGWHVHLETNSGANTDLGLLPSVPNQDDITFTVVSSDDGFAVVAAPFAGPAALTPVVEYDSTYAAHHFVHLRTDGIGAGTEFTCYTLVSSALGCSDEGMVVRVDTDAATAPQATHVSSEVSEVAATQDYTGYTTLDSTDDDGEVPACPCSLRTIPVGGTVATAKRGHLPIAAIAAWDNDNFFYTSATPVTPPGLFRSISASSKQYRVATAPHASLSVRAVTLGAGRAVWADDSAAGNVVSSRAVRVSKGHAVLGATTKVSSGLPDELSASGVRVAFSTNTSGPIRVQSPSQTVTIAHGQVRTISGTRVLYQASGSAAHWIIYNLVTKKKLDVTAKFGLVDDEWPALWGNYLAYFKANGSVWRARLSGSPSPVKLSGAVSQTDGGMVQMWGDWVAWRADRLNDAASILRARNARTLAPAHALGNAFDVDGSSAAGVVVSYGENRYKVLSWPNAALVATVPSSFGDAPAVDGQFLAYLNSVGVPVVAPLTDHVVNRPRSLGNASAPKSVTHGHSWSLDLVTSAALTSCSVRITHGSTLVKTLGCAAAARKLGEVRATWNATGADQTDHWRVVAKNADGSLLATGGSAAATTGVIHVH